MKNFILFFGIILSFAMTGCKMDKDAEIKTVEVTSSNETASLDPNATYAKAEFAIDGMTCAVGCAKTIEKKLAKMDGVKSARVDFDKKLAMVEYNEDKVSPSNLEEAVKMAGAAYSVENMQTVEKFSADKTTSELSNCPPDCKKDCCKENMSCPEDCKMACCTGK